MKKTFLYSVLFATILLVASCEKEKAVVDYLPATISNYQGMGGTKVYIDNGNYACWSPSGDVVKLNSDNANVVAQRDGHFKIAVATPADEYVAIFPANAVTDAANHSVTLPAIQHYEEVSSGVQKVNALMAAKGTTRLDFKNICALLKVSVAGLPASAFLTEIEVTHSASALAGSGTITFSDGVPSLNMASNGSKMIKLQFDGNGHDNGDYYITVPPVTGTFKVRVLYRAPDANGAIQLYTKTFTQSTSCTINANEIGPVAASGVSTNPVEHLPGAFSTGDGLVYFSRGLLKATQASGQTMNWLFENNQYTTTLYQHSGTGHNATVSATGYFPWSSADDDGDAGAHFEFPILSNSHESNNFYDWGKHWGTSPQHWRTLSDTEWGFLLNTRSASTITVPADPVPVNVPNARYAYAKVNGQIGLLLFPDIFSWPVTVYPDRIPSSINTPAAWDDVNNYSLDEWKELEDAGCVFLPARGYWPYNNPSNPPVDADQGYYWTSHFSGDNGNANYMHFTATNDPSTTSSFQYGNGCFVRLVYAY